ncbi:MULTISPECIES: WhiB family transcriptional regulator [Streptosporangium]|jgi:WhiB family redox-sensing transcriptional regulator|uniref:Transcriptional regulator WhiB n=1 Tax=Streptosporangium subroseum TaxID=106412 RepID=A0A239AYQ0_9ACTN|nr:WhiB family transcriptional regulator [Streptosporangium sp. 'caverna']WSA13768.1 WhiB family transcriptional regulator [Streptosporangium subroseum]SNS00144.1 WhiB family transcriptional regulator, redox-sensing transcriptional regulator [Streptosporangium subroseum]
MYVQNNVIAFAHWSRRSSCLGEDPELFFPVSSEGPGQVQYERAKAVCRRCPVRGRCLEYALSTQQMYGVWGGTTPEERRATMSQMRRGVR